MLNASKIAEQALERAEGIKKQRVIRRMYKRVATVIALCAVFVGIFAYNIMINRATPSDSVDIEAMPVPLAVSVSQCQPESGVIVCPSCGYEIIEDES